VPGDHGEQTATGDGGVLGQRGQAEMVLRELRPVEAVISHLLASSHARARRGRRWISAGREAIADRQDSFRQINLADRISEPLRDPAGGFTMSVLLVPPSTTRKMAMQRNMSRGQICLENFVLGKAHLIRISSERRAPALKPLIVAD